MRSKGDLLPLVSHKPGPSSFGWTPSHTSITFNSACPHPQLPTRTSSFSDVKNRAQPLLLWLSPSTQTRTTSVCLPHFDLHMDQDYFYFSIFFLPSICIRATSVSAHPHPPTQAGISSALASHSQEHSSKPVWNQSSGPQCCWRCSWDTW